MADSILLLIIGFLVLSGLQAVFVVELISKEMGPKVVFLIFSSFGILLGMLCCIGDRQYHASFVQARITSIEYHDKEEAVVMVEFIYKNKLYHQQIRSHRTEIFYNVDDTIEIGISNGDVQKAYVTTKYGPGAHNVGFMGGMARLFGGAGMIVFIPTVISMIVLYIKKNKQNNVLWC